MTGEIVARVVRALERFYRVPAEDPRPFVRSHEEDCGREVLLVREAEDAVEVSLVLPKHLEHARWESLGLDDRCQIVEGASHFFMVCARAQAERPTTHLELELQAEVDKWLILSDGGRLDVDDDAALRDALYEGTFLHAEASVEGARYRLATSMAARFVHKLSCAYVRTGRRTELRHELVRFFHATQEEKLRAAAA